MTTHEGIDSGLRNLILAGAAAALARAAGHGEGGVACRAAVRRSVAETVQALGGLDILVNNVGISISGATETMSFEDIDALLRIMSPMSYGLVRGERLQLCGAIVNRHGRDDPCAAGPGELASRCADAGAALDEDDIAEPEGRAMHHGVVLGAEVDRNPGCVRARQNSGSDALADAPVGGPN